MPRAFVLRMCEETLHKGPFFVPADPTVLSSPPYASPKRCGLHLSQVGNRPNRRKGRRRLISSRAAGAEAGQRGPQPAVVTKPGKW